MYFPRPLQSFILRDPKTRTISVSDFRDRVVHHALVNILQLIFEPRFIYDSYGSSKGKGTLAALKRFDAFLRKVTMNGKLQLNSKKNIAGFVLKADIKSYFGSVDHDVLIDILKKRVTDGEVIWLVERILRNYNSEVPGKGMPLGNWTSQFFANVYLNELDQFVKHELGAKYYLRYVDDFVILEHSKVKLQEYLTAIREFLRTLKLELHPTKCRIVPAGGGTALLGFRAFYRYKLVRRRNLRRFHTRLASLLKEYKEGVVSADFVLNKLKGWNGYALQGNTHMLRKKLQMLVEKELQKEKS